MQSFLFTLISGPLVESTHNEIKFTAPLTGITAAVVGVILNLAMLFGYHVLWPKVFGGAFDWPCAAIAAAAAIALFRFKRGVIEVLFACALTGLAVHLGRHETSGCAQHCCQCWSINGAFRPPPVVSSIDLQASSSVNLGRPRPRR
ncbi:hypothetical protein PputGB1_2961 [Pseudomonas putida GB-1]|uniref:Chromate transporter n=1 Tax=Pseudomonas putida (strain GB-1) TaxID=76869 RepID=B0KFD0_PSEPG|nr:hypothetical protein PputGB1_2961 [Pseudomonas putida GB-1]